MIIDLLWFDGWKESSYRIFLPSWWWFSEFRYSHGSSPVTSQPKEQIQVICDFNTVTKTLIKLTFFKDDKLASSSKNHSEPIQKEKTKRWGLWKVWEKCLTHPERNIQALVTLAISSSSQSHPSRIVLLEHCAEWMDGFPKKQLVRKKKKLKRERSNICARV